MGDNIEDEKTASFSQEGGVVVLLTGSTGNLGSYLLDLLLQTEAVSRIICLNRSPDALERQIAAFIMRGLDPTPLRNSDPMATRVRFLQAQLHEPRFGLGDEVYNHLVETVDLVIHNAWPVDFLCNIKSFQPSIQGVENLLRFCRAVQSCRHDIQLTFVSSISVASNWASATQASRSQIPEAELGDWKLARTGYGQSKLLTERLLARSASPESSHPLRIIVARVGQLSGPVSHGNMGVWPSQEWIPSLIRSSIILGVVPDSLGPASRVDWVPVDKAARAIVDISTHFLAPPEPRRPPQNGLSGLLRGYKRQNLGARFFHVVNPRETSWASILPAIVKHLPPTVRTCDFSQWTDKLRASIQSSHLLEDVQEGRNPAAKLYDTYETLQDRAIRFPYALSPKFSTTKIAAISPTMAHLPPVSIEWVELWMQQWGRAWN